MLTTAKGVALALGLALTVACQAPAPRVPTPGVPTQVSAVPTPTQSPLTQPAVAPKPTATAASPAPPPAGASRVETLNAANAAFARRDLAAAAGLYDRVLNTPPTGEPAETTQLIDGFAHFRAMVTLLAQGSEDEARAHLDALQQRNPAGPFARLASQLWDQYSMTAQLRGACAQLQPQIASQAGAALSQLQALGVSVDAATLCRA